MPVTTLAIQHVDHVPDVLDGGTLYLSAKYSTAIHLCACGCGSETVTPIGPGQWTADIGPGGLTLSPSVGNYQIPCKSHYWIRDSRVVWCR